MRLTAEEIQATKAFAQEATLTDSVSRLGVDLDRAKRILLRLIGALSASEAARAALREALSKIAGLDSAKDTDEGFNEWGEAKCFEVAQEISRSALAKDKELGG